MKPTRRARFLDQFPAASAKVDEIRRSAGPSATWATLTFPTDPELSARLRTAARRRLTPAEAFEQRLSWAMSALPAGSTMTREQVAGVRLPGQGGLDLAPTP